MITHLFAVYIPLNGIFICDWLLSTEQLVFDHMNLMCDLVPKDGRFKDVYVGACGGAATFIQIGLSPQGPIPCSTASLQCGPGLGFSASAPT